MTRAAAGHSPAAPEYRGRPLARREHFCGALITVRDVPGGIEVSFAMSGTRFWLDRGGGWFEEQAAGQPSAQPPPTNTR